MDSFNNFNDKMRIIQEIVPGKQITVAHVIASPDEKVYEKAHLKKTELGSAIGILNLTPAETVIIASDICIKGGAVEIEMADRINGTLIITGKVSEVEAALTAAVNYSRDKLGFTVCDVTKT